MIDKLNLEEHIDFKDNHEEAKEWAKPYEEYVKTLADNQKEAIKKFTTDPSKINEYLEGRDVDPDKEIDIVLESERFKLDYITSGVKIPENLKIYQRMSAYDMDYDNLPLINEDGEFNNLAANDLIEGLKKAPFRMQHGYMIGSLTKDPSTSSMKLPIRAEFILSKGTEGLYIGVENIADNPMIYKCFVNRECCFNFKREGL
ncbi:MULTISPECIES: ADP-ribosyltransferase [unclassified Bacillus cereus group]|uniref:ADP-ribosyltransferase n=1 Tax=unclassified Bacillus cereus group TaxID=2750818 RepID=UPI0012989027|nr:MULTISPECIES: ADP-ribosyltransferase [unclassified Bacillus cereus group]MEB8716473.1 ADP-ribosyltransferase [Bacillus cereus]MRB05791.1 hypothetical protein [Bacillus thuringiensis]MEB9434993.1 ADP-ribosyltransferase [Bacillus cereus]MEB9483610.1 ADP-ribosyltransferase [Bacillus cereus]MRC49791.1 hypothetical protein [Bacillus thuringiensis]